MSRLFVRASGNYLTHPAAILPAEPFSISAWVYPTSLLNGTREIVAIGTSSTVDHQHLLRHGGDDRILISTRDTITSSAQSIVIPAANQWYHACGVWPSTSSRSVYVNGGNKGTNTAIKSVATMNVTRIGTLANVGVNYYDGRIAEVCIWSVALTDAEVAALASGLNPRQIRPNSIAGYWPLHGLTDPEPDLSGNRINMSLVNAPAAAPHAPVRLRRSLSFLAPAAAPATVTENLAPNAVLATSNLQDTGANSPPTLLTDIDDSPDSSDDNWWTAVDATGAVEARVGLPTPSGALLGTQTFRALLRKTAGTPDPTVDIELWEAGSFVSTLQSGVVITSTTGQIVSATWAPAAITNAADVEVRIVATPGAA